MSTTESTNVDTGTVATDVAKAKRHRILAAIYWVGAIIGGNLAIYFWSVVSSASSGVSYDPNTGAPMLTDGNSAGPNITANFVYSILGTVFFALGFIVRSGWFRNKPRNGRFGAVLNLAQTLGVRRFYLVVALCLTIVTSYGWRGLTMFVLIVAVYHLYNRLTAAKVEAANTIKAKELEIAGANLVVKGLDGTPTGYTFQGNFPMETVQKFGLTTGHVFVPQVNGSVNVYELPKTGKVG
ncbi:MAG TPA: hypothetical protein VFT64_05960 [Rickettsiales bacterium]|nr:hypothetical protein [Rickettsiales bacterium]